MVKTNFPDAEAFLEDSPGYRMSWGKGDVAHGIEY